jgi:hypothetical protein
MPALRASDRAQGLRVSTCTRSDGAASC